MRFEKAEAECDGTRHDKEDQLVEAKMIPPDDLKPPRRMTMLVKVQDLEGTDGVGFNPSIADGPDDRADNYGEKFEMRVKDLVYLLTCDAGYAIDKAQSSHFRIYCGHGFCACGFL